jgi:GNAT superfamily N-acetyltransferase
MANFSIRAARAADITLIAQLIRELAEFERLSDDVVLDEATLANHLFGDRPYAEVLIAEDGGANPVGFALYFHTFSTFLGRPGLYLEDLFVREHARGSGVGRALLRELARIAVERECGRLEWAVLDWNESAIRFYRSLGALPNDEWTTYRLHGDNLAALAEA